ncbi:MAG TPA: PEP/pyruvate-binding domain-containing protein [Polyangia bacterium]|nr:PEP/pyruvate-binding domain-containing protein [Polyangia bacterium]
MARARAAGLRVADGAVVLPDEPVDAAELAAQLARLGGGRFVVRSSASLEDRAGATAAGVFVSVVADAAEVAHAIEVVRASADGPAVRAYLAARGATEAVRMAVLVQPWIAAPEYGVAHSAGAQFRVETRAAGEPEWGDVRPSVVARDDAGALATGLRALETLVGGDVDAELARDGDVVTWLQARPLQVAHDGNRASRAANVPSLPLPGRWTRDAEHNPDPLSPAHASLVAFVDGWAWARASSSSPGSSTSNAAARRVPKSRAEGRSRSPTCAAASTTRSRPIVGERSPPRPRRSPVRWPRSRTSFAAMSPSCRRRCRRRAARSIAGCARTPASRSRRTPRCSAASAARRWRAISCCGGSVAAKRRSRNT